MTSYVRHFPDVESASAVPCTAYLHFEAAEHGRRQSEPPDDEGLALVGELPVGGRGQLAQPQEGAPLTLLLRPQVHVLHEIQGYHTFKLSNNICCISLFYGCPISVRCLHRRRLREADLPCPRYFLLLGVGRFHEMDATCYQISLHIIHMRNHSNNQCPL